MLSFDSHYRSNSVVATVNCLLRFTLNCRTITVDLEFASKRVWMNILYIIFHVVYAKPIFVVVVNTVFAQSKKKFKYHLLFMH